jgi:hypothetical protein
VITEAEGSSMHHILQTNTDHTSENCALKW